MDEWKRHFNLMPCDPGCSIFYNESAPNRVINLVPEFVVAGIVYGETHAVGVHGKNLCTMKEQVAIHSERNRPPSQKRNSVASMNSGQFALNRRQINFLRLLPKKT